MSKQRIFHSGCPGKRDINAPEFTLTEKPMVTSKNILNFFRCNGCKTEIMVGEPLPEVTKDE